MKYTLYDWGGANLWLFHLINNWRGDILDRVMLFGTQISDHRTFPVYVMVGLLAALFLSARSHANLLTAHVYVYRWILVLGVFCTADGFFLILVKPWLDFPWPPLALPDGAVHIVGKPGLYQSLPSRHVSFAVALVASFWPMLRPSLRGLAIAIVCWIMVSKVNVGAHFPADARGCHIAIAWSIVRNTISRPPIRAQSEVVRSRDPGNQS